MDKSQVAIIIPALNEAKTIQRIIESVKSYGTVIVVNDGSIDDTEEISITAGAIVVKHSNNKGYDAALLSGFSKAEKIGKKIIVSIDADGQHNPKYLSEMILAISSGEYKIALAYRQKTARLAEYLFKVIARYKYGAEDILCGLKAFHVDLFNEHKEIMNNNTMGTGLAIHSLRSGNKVFQIPIYVEDREDAPRIGSLIKANWLIFKGMMLSLK